jgi:hypothetical protein
MKEDTRWMVIAGIGLLTLSLVMYTAHYLIFQDSHHMWIFFMGDLAFIPIEVLIVTIIIDRTIDSREKQQRLEKLNLVIGTFFSKAGNPLLAKLSQADPGLTSITERLVIGDGWKPDDFRTVRTYLENHPCNIAIDRIELESLREFLVNNEDFVLRIVENPMVFEHESFTELILALGHATEELKMRNDFSTLPPADKAHLAKDLQRVYSRLIFAWVKYMEYLKANYPYLFSLAMRTNPFDASASVVIGKAL